MRDDDALYVARDRSTFREQLDPPSRIITESGKLLLEMSPELGIEEASVDRIGGVRRSGVAYGRVSSLPPDSGSLGPCERAHHILIKS